MAACLPKKMPITFPIISSKVPLQALATLEVPIGGNKVIQSQFLFGIWLKIGHHVIQQSSWVPMT